MIVAGTVYPEHLTLRQIMLFKKICSTDSMKESTGGTQTSCTTKLNNQFDQGNLKVL